MISRRSILSLLGFLPFAGKSVLASLFPGKPTPIIPPGFFRCGIRGEYNGVPERRCLSKTPSSSSGEPPPMSLDRESLIQEMLRNYPTLTREKAEEMLIAAGS